jgi:hypothetical protein
VDESSRVHFEEVPLTASETLLTGTSLFRCVPGSFPKSMEIPSDSVKTNGDKVLLFEGCRSNNKAAFFPNQNLLMKIIRFCQTEKFDLRIVKISHSNKAYCNAAQNPIVHFLQCLMAGGDTMRVDAAVIDHDKLVVADAVTLPLRALYERDPALHFINKDFHFYTDFSEYYRTH